MLYPYNGMLFNNKKEWSADLYYNMDESQTHHAEWEKTDTRNHMWCGSIYVTWPEEANP